MCTLRACLHIELTVLSRSYVLECRSSHLTCLTASTTPEPENLDWQSPQISSGKSSGTWLDSSTFTVVLGDGRKTTLLINSTNFVKLEFSDGHTNKNSHNHRFIHLVLHKSWPIGIYVYENKVRDRGRVAPEGEWFIAHTYCIWA